MKQFSDFKIKPVAKNFGGDKIGIDDILNKQITVHDFKIGVSKFEAKPRLDLSITFDGRLRLYWSNSAMLIEMIKQIPKEEMPFETTIVKENKQLRFT